MSKAEWQLSKVYENTHEKAQNSSFYKARILVYRGKCVSL